MTTVSEQDTAQALSPSALPAALRERLLSSMQQAAEDCRGEAQLEQLLRQKFSPAPMPPRMEGRLGVQMYLQAVEEHRKWYSFLLHRTGAAAAALVICVGATLAFYGSHAMAGAEGQGQVSRSVLDTYGDEDIRWEQNGVPVRRCDVLYEDTFVMEDEGGMTIMVRVPNRRTITIEEEVL